jgi:hypothetical protein
MGSEGRLRVVAGVRLEAEYGGREGVLTIKETILATASQDEQKRPLVPRADRVPHR